MAPPLGPNDWEDMVAAAPWFAKPDKGDRVTGAASFAPSEAFRETFPVLTALLSSARTVTVEVHEKTYQMWAWTNAAGKSYGWVGPLPDPDAEKRADLHPVHRVLLGAFGGIVETWNGPDDTNDNWLGNLYWALGAEDSKDWRENPHRDLYDYYLQRVEDDDYVGLYGAEFVGADYADVSLIVFAVEANSDLRLYDLATSRPYFLAHDTGETNVTLVINAPNETLYTINDCETLQTWVETVAAQWAALQSDTN